MLHLAMLLLMHATEIQLNDVKLNVVSPHGLSLNFDSDEAKRKSMAQMQIKSEYRLECQTIFMGVKIERNSHYRLKFTSDKLTMHSEDQFMHPLIELKNCGLDICVPFLLSVSESLS